MCQSHCLALLKLDAYTMRDLRLLAVISLLVGAAESRSIQLGLPRLVKELALNGGGAGPNDALAYNNVENYKSKFGYVQGGKVGIILLDNFKELEKYLTARSKDVDFERELAIINLFRENSDDLFQSLKVLDVTKDKNGKKEDGKNKLEEILKRKKGKNVFKFMEDYKNEGDSKEYDNFEEMDDRKTKVNMPNFSEDEYNEYDENDEAAEEVSNEEDESEEEKFYSEEEKYYEDEENDFKSSERKVLLMDY